MSTAGSTDRGRPLRIGYVGAGGFTNRFVFPQLGSHAVQLVAVCDLVEEKARQAQAQYGFAHAYTDFRAMCDEQSLDAVFCVGGPRVHYAVGRELLERGLPLYVQKPPALTAALTQELADLARERSIVCHVGFNIRSSAAGLRAREIMGTPDFGRPTLCLVRYGFVAGATIEDAVLDQHCHAVDMARYLMGEVESVQVTAGRLAGVRHYVVALRFAGGAVGTLNFTSEQGGREFFYFEVTGERGHLLTSHQFALRYKQAAAPAAASGPRRSRCSRRPPGGARSPSSGWATSRTWPTSWRPCGGRSRTAAPWGTPWARWPSARRSAGSSARPGAGAPDARPAAGRASIDGSPTHVYTASAVMKSGFTFGGGAG